MSLESFTYGGEVIGGATPTHNTEILDHYMFVTGQDDAEFVTRFVVRVTPSGNPTTDYNSLAAACLAIEAALRQRYQKLTVNWGASQQESFDPTPAVSTGFDQEPHLEKARDFPNSGEARAYDFRVGISQPPNFTDAFGTITGNGADGRRTVNVSLHYDTNERLSVSMTGVWTQAPSLYARQKFLAIFDGVSGYAAYRLSIINSATPPTGQKWALTRRDESDPLSFSTLTFSREYQQQVDGRRGSSVEIFYGETNQRVVTIRGVYLRTIVGTGGTFGNVYGVASGSRANFLDPVTGGYAFALTQLAALGLNEGGPLTVGDNCELLKEPYATTNEQDDRTEYDLVFRELIQQQSNATGSFLDDPNIIGDSMQFAAFFHGLNDSPEPAGAQSIPGPLGSAATPSATPSKNDGNGSNPGTYSPPATPDKATNPGSQGGQTIGSTPVIKPVDLSVSYDAWFKTTVLNPYEYWTDNVLPLLLSTFERIFGFGPMEFVGNNPMPEITNNHLRANLTLRAYQGDVILFTFSLGLANDLGIRVDPAFSGTPHEYLVQQALPKSTMTRKVEAVYKAGSGFTLDKFLTPPVLSGWVKLSDSKPNTVTRVLGIPNQGVPTTSLTYASLEESLIWVARNVGQQAGGGSSDNRTITTSGVPSLSTVSPGQATGQVL